MRFRLGIVAIVFRKTRKEIRFLLLHRIQNWKGYEFVKGGLLEDEAEWETVNREVKEETGFKPIEMIKTAYNFEYKWPRDYVKDGNTYNGMKASLFLVEVKGDKVSLDKSEHDNYKWVTKEKALKYLTYKNHKDALKYVLENYF